MYKLKSASCGMTVKASCERSLTHSRRPAERITANSIVYRIGPGRGRE